MSCNHKRLAAGGRLDRSVPIEFKFDGRSLTGYRGVIGKRAVNQIMDTGTVLSKRGVLSKPEPADIGRGAEGKTGGETDVVPPAHGDEASKEKHRASFLPEAA
jgi:hypothetical protein